MGQRTYRNKLRRYQRLRQNQTEQQYEYLTERHVICPSHPKYAVLDHFSHLANNVYNQGLYRARQALFKGEWLSYQKLDASLKKSKRQKDSMIYGSMSNVHLVQQQLKLVRSQYGFPGIRHVRPTPRIPASSRDDRSCQDIEPRED